MQPIYLVEDDANIRDLVLYALRSSGFDAEGFETAQPFYQALRVKRPALALLDIMLPEEDGLSILRKLRSRPDTQEIPVIMLTARSSEYDKVLGLDSGADDYLAKPFGVMELLSRVRAVLRRAGGDHDTNTVAVEDVVVDTERRTVFAHGEPVELTRMEFELLHYLMINQGLVMTRDRILSAVWDCDFEGESRTVDVHIKTLRQKLGDSADIIKTVRGVGYRVGGSL